MTSIQAVQSIRTACFGLPEAENSPEPGKERSGSLVDILLFDVACWDGSPTLRMIGCRSVETDDLRRGNFGISFEFQAPGAGNADAV